MEGTELTQHFGVDGGHRNKLPQGKGGKSWGPPSIPHFIPSLTLGPSNTLLRQFANPHSSLNSSLHSLSKLAHPSIWDILISRLPSLKLYHSVFTNTQPSLLTFRSTPLRASRAFLTEYLRGGDLPLRPLQGRGYIRPLLTLSFW